MKAEMKIDYWAPDPEACPALVLLVDDQALVAAALQRAIAGETGVDLHYCANPIEALTVACELKPTVILLDLVMPQVDGLTLLKKFRANPVTAYTPIVVLSTKEDAESKSELFAAGANDYMVKLPDRLELLARIKYHSMSAWHRIQRDEAFEALRRSQQALVASNTALVAANEQLGKATQAKAHFLTCLTHELTPPIKTIASEAGRLLEKGAEEGAPAHGPVLAIRGMAEHLGRLIDDVRDFSVMEAGSVTLEPADFDLAEVFDELLEVLAGAAAAKRLYLAAIVPPKTPTLLHGDPRRLRQVLANLVINGLQFTSEGGVCLSVSELSETELQAILCFEVQDTGVGIAPEAQAMIFQPFSQGAELPRSGRGAGLGLAICRQLVELMGGHIGLESLPGRGSIFRLTIPFGKQHRAESSPAAKPGREVPCRRVLVVASDEWVRRTLERQMHYFGLHVNGAAGAEEAARMLREPGGLPFDVVLLHSPVEEASPLAAKIRAEPTQARVVLLAPEGSVDGTPWGIDAILESPLRRETVLRLLE